MWHQWEMESKSLYDSHDSRDMISRLQYCESSGLMGIATFVKDVPLAHIIRVEEGGALPQISSPSIGFPCRSTSSPNAALISSMSLFIAWTKRRTSMFHKTMFMPARAQRICF